MNTRALAIEHVKRQKARYCRYVDTKRWQDLAAIFVHNPQIKMTDPAGQVVASFDNIDEFISATSSFLDGARSIHQIHNDELDHLSETEIKAVWSMEDLIEFPPSSDRPSRLNGYGHYHEVWRLSGEQWQIAKLELRRTILEITPGSGVL